MDLYKSIQIIIIENQLYIIIHIYPSFYYNIIAIVTSNLTSYVCKLPIADHVMLSRELFLYVSEN